MNYPYPIPSPYIQAAMSQAVQSLMLGGPLPPSCVIMPMPFQQPQQILPQLMMNPAIGGGDPRIFAQKTPYFGSSPYSTNLPLHPSVPQQNYNYPIVPYKHPTKKTHQKPHSNIYNSSSFDSYMHELSWSRLFDHPIRKISKKQPAIKSDKNQRSNSSSSSSSSTSDTTIRRVDVTTKQSSNGNPKHQTKDSLPFKYSSEYVPGTSKQQSRRPKSNDVFIIKKP